MKEQSKSRYPPSEDPVNKIKLEVKVSLEWTKGILKSVGASLKQLVRSLAGIINYFRQMV